MQLFTAPFTARALAISLLLAGACTSKQNEPAPASTMSWTVDNTTYQATTATAISRSSSIDLTGVATAGTSSHAINLSVPAAVGTYSTTAPAPAYYYLAYNISAGPSSAIYSAANGGGNGTGTVTITAFSATDITGTFAFIGGTASGGPGKTITNGSFAIKR